MNGSMIVGRLSVSFDRGVSTNKAPDLGLEQAPDRTEDGKLVRGLGTHYRSDEAKATAKELAKQEGQIREAFRRAFLSSSIPGFYVLPESGAGRELLSKLTFDARINAHVSEYQIALNDRLPPVEITEWASRVKRQLTDVPLGKSTDPAAEGLVTLESLAMCPALDDETSETLLGLIADAKLQAITRVELRREIKAMKVGVSFSAKPRRVKAQAAAKPDGKALKPRRGAKAKKEDEAAA